MARKLLFVHRYEEAKDDFRFIVALAELTSAFKIKVIVENCELLVTAEGLSSSTPTLTDEVKLLLNYGVEIVWMKSKYYSPDLPHMDIFETQFNLTSQVLIEAGIKMVDNAYKYVAESIRDGYELIKW